VGAAGWEKPENWGDQWELGRKNAACVIRNQSGMGKSRRTALGLLYGNERNIQFLLELPYLRKFIIF
jgi:hypothetical protein